jgi:hypothetical protein
MDNTFEEKLIDKLPGPNIITADLYKDYLIAGDNKGTVLFFRNIKSRPFKKKFRYNIYEKIRKYSIK